ncbi:MAG: succinylglutamate desuccinylase/aspartoacylase family protein, partial [Acidobacteriota bacterium]|nr:succinylglutamate desuccinylase/aspartoacylase family protein [Acidobacteriota bacterium]
MEILGHKIRNGVRNYLELEVASLYTRTRIAIPVIVQKASRPGPVLLVISGIHGDEVNGIEINRRLLLEKLLKPVAGTVISIPIANVMAFINLERKFSDGRDLNRSFPGSQKGSMAAQIGHLLSSRIIPIADVVIDLHTGSEDRSNASQIRYDTAHPENAQLAKLFNAPFALLQLKPPTGSLRRLLNKKKISTVIFEGGKSRSIDNEIVADGMRGVLNIAEYLGIVEKSDYGRNPVKTKYLAKSHWVRAGSSGMLQPVAANGKNVEAGEILAFINGPYAQFQKKV